MAFSFRGMDAIISKMRKGANYEKQIRAAVMGFAAVIITGGVLLWATSPGMTIKRKYECYNGKAVDGKHILQEITLPVYDKYR